MLSVKQGGTEKHFFRLWYDSTWNWTPVFPSHWRTIYPLSQSGVFTRIFQACVFYTWKLVGWLVDFCGISTFVGHSAPNSVYIYIHIQPKISKRILRLVEFSISRISFVCTRLTRFSCHIFWYNSVSLKKDRMSSILTFSNRSVKLFTLKNRFLITAKVLHSIRMCLTMQVVWQVKHCACASCFKMKEWLSLVWPTRNRDISPCSLLDFLDAGLHSPKVGWIWKSLLWMLLPHGNKSRMLW